MIRPAPAAAGGAGGAVRPAGIAVLIATLLGILLGLATPAGAQAALRARVELGGLVLEAPPELHDTLQELAPRAAQILPRIEKALGVRAEGPILMVVIPPGPLVDPEISRLDQAAPPWAAGFALSEQRVGAIRLGQADRYPFGDPFGVLAHEVAHILIHDAAGDNVPRWFNEGVATWVQRGWSLQDAMVYSSSLLVGPLPSLARLDRAFVASEGGARMAYAASFDFVHWATREYGDDLVPRVLAAARDQPFRAAWREVTGVPLSASEEAWRDTALTWHRWVPALTGAGTLWMAVTLLFLVAAWRRRVHTREAMERLEEADEEPRAASWRPRGETSEDEGRTGEPQAGGWAPPERDGRRDEDGRWIN